MRLSTNREHSLAAIAPLLICASLLLLLSFGYRSGLGLFLQPVSEANGWGRDVFSLALAIQNLAWGVAAVFAGALADKYSLLRVMLVAVVCYALGLIGMAYVSSEAGFVFVAGVVIGCGIAGTSFGIVLPALARAAGGQGKVLGIATAAGSMGQFLLVPVMQEIIEFSGWFWALQIIGISALLMAVLALPLSPYSGANDASGRQADASLAVVVFRALRVRSYLCLTLGFFVCGFHIAFILVHLPSYLVDLGFDARVGAWGISIIGLCNVAGSYLSGVACSRIAMRNILIFIYCARAVAIALFLLAPLNVLTVYTFCAVMGFLWLATIPPTSSLVMVFFGTRYMTLLYSVVFFSHQLGSFSGVWLAGWFYETFGNYSGIWIMGIAFSVVATALHMPIREYLQSNSLYVSR